MLEGEPPNFTTLFIARPPVGYLLCLYLIITQPRKLAVKSNVKL